VTGVRSCMTRGALGVAKLGTSRTKATDKMLGLETGIQCAEDEVDE